MLARSGQAVELKVRIEQGADVPAIIGNKMRVELF